MKKFTLSLICILAYNMLFAQLVTVEGYAFESGNRGFLNQVGITLFDADSKAVKGTTMTDPDGYFSFDVAPNTDFMVRGEKKGFESPEVEFTTKGKVAGDKVFLKMEIEREPGYIFDVTMAERRPAPGVPVDAISDSFIEIYNNTTKKEELVKRHHPSPSFNFTFEQGNHYTVMIRKSGFFTKRMEAYVNVEGCILCFDGVGDVRPGVSDVMTKDNMMGTLLANVELDRVELNKIIAIENIYYDLAKWDIREDAAVELDKLVTVLKDNPALQMELGSHTDSRGRDGYNLDLSEKRANAAVEYLVANGVEAGRINAKGYGETILKNKCANGVKCSERRHQQNRRTELRITGILDDDPYTKPTLKEIIEEEAFQQMLKDVQSGKVIKVGEGQALPEELIEQRKKEQEEILKQRREEQKKIKQSQIEIPSAPEQIDTPQMEQAPIGETPAIEMPAMEVPKEEPMPDLGSTITVGEKVPTPPTKVEVPVIEKPVVKKPPVPTAESGKKIFSGKDIESMENNNLPEKIKDSKMVQEEKISSVGSPQLRSIPSDYTGYRVQLITANSKLPGSHQIFSQHGDLAMEETKDGTFAYLLGDFNQLKDTEGFLQHIVLPRYPNAKIIQYLDGKRIVK